MIIAVGSDHRGLTLKNEVREILKGMGHTCKDFGCYSEQPVDYPDVAKTLAEAIVKRECGYGILICGTGIGMSISANKVAGIRAALCFDALSACRARQHNDANVLCLGAEREQTVEEIIQLFLTTEFEGGRHQKRLDKIKAMEC